VDEDYLTPEENGDVEDASVDTEQGRVLQTYADTIKRAVTGVGTPELALESTNNIIQAFTNPVLAKLSEYLRNQSPASKDGLQTAVKVMKDVVRESYKPEFTTRNLRMDGSPPVKTKNAFTFMFEDQQERKVLMPGVEASDAVLTKLERALQPDNAPFEKVGGLSVLFELVLLGPPDKSATKEALLYGSYAPESVTSNTNRFKYVSRHYVLTSADTRVPNVTVETEERGVYVFRYVQQDTDTQSYADYANALFRSLVFLVYVGKLGEKALNNTLSDLLAKGEDGGEFSVQKQAAQEDTRRFLEQQFGVQMLQSQRSAVVSLRSLSRMCRL